MKTKISEKPASEMTMREVVAMFFILQFAANDETSFHERFAKLIAAAEREDCAQICDAEATIEGVAQRCAAAIRARRNT